MHQIKTCSWSDCTSMVEGRTEYCATHGHLIRKQERERLKVRVVQPIRKVSVKQAKQNQDYGVLSRQYKAEHPECEVRIEGVCDGMTTDVHHRAGRRSNLLDASTFIAVCRSCHTYIHDKMSAEERREKGLLITRNNETV